VFPPDRGEVLVGGKQVDLVRPDDARRAGVATIYQELLLFPELTVAENVFMGHAPRKGLGRLDWRAMREKTRALLASLEIHDLQADRVVGSLSVGNRQRVEILRALSQDARILIMDEPTAALGVPEQRKVVALIKSLKAQGRGVIFISHNLQDIFAVSDRIVVLRRGIVAGERNIADTNHEEVVKLMIGG